MSGASHTPLEERLRFTAKHGLLTASMSGMNASHSEAADAITEASELIEQLEESFTAGGTYQQFLPAMRAYLKKVRDQ